jgi:type II secretory pathway component GspD/PulD (secretin)
MLPRPIRAHLSALTLIAVLSPSAARAQQIDPLQTQIQVLRFDEATTLLEALNAVLAVTDVSVIIPEFGTAQDSVRIGRMVLRNVTLADALTYLLEPQDLRYSLEEGNFLRIEPNIVERYIRYEHLAGRFAAMTGAAGAGGAAGGAAAAGGGAAGAGGVGGAGGTGILTPEQFEEDLKELLSPTAILAVDRETHLIYVEDYALNVERLVRFIEAIDRPMRQVEIQMQLIEVVRTDDTSYGVEYAASVSGSPDVESILIELPGLAQTGFVADMTGFALGGLYGGDLDLDAALRAISTIASAELLSKPRTVVMDGKPANIDLTDQIPYTEAVLGTGFVTAQTRFEDVGIQMMVTPTILDSVTVQLQVQLEVSSAPTRTAEGVPTIANRQATSVVAVGDGEVFVMGGLLRKEDVETITGIPILQSIPLLGALFRTTQLRKETRELLILVKPRIISPYRFDEPAPR